jgi:hypothetical protein
MGDEFLDTFFLGELIWTGNKKRCILKPEEIAFKEKDDTNFS